MLLSASAWFSWQQVWREAEAEVTRTAEAGAEYARRVLDGLLLRADRANELLAGLSDAEIRAREAELHLSLRALGQRTQDDGTQHAFLHDREARSLVSGALYPVPPVTEDFTDRDYNQALRGPDALAFHLGSAFMARGLNRPFFSVARRREGAGNGLPRGAYDGVVVVSADSNAIGDGLRRLVPGEGVGSDDVLALLRDDGEVLARSKGMTAVLPQAGLQDPALRAVANGADRGIALVRSGVDGVERLSALRRVDAWPAIVSVARPRSAIVARWFEAVALQLAFGVPAALALAGLALVVRRGQLELAAANAGLEQRVDLRTAEVRDALALLDTVYATAPVGLCAFDMQGRYLRVNAMLAEINGVAPEGHIGRTIRDLVPALADVAEALLRQVIETGQPVLGQEMEGETSAQPGVLRAWVADWSALRDGQGEIIGVNVVVREVTEARAAARALAVSDALLRDTTSRLSTLVDALHLGVALSDTQGRLLVANAAMRRFVPEIVPSRDEARLHRWRGYHPNGQRIEPSDYAAARALRGETVLPGLELIFTEDDGSTTWTRVSAVPLRDEDGAVTGAALIVEDIHAQKASEEHRALLMAEVDHRARNALAVVLATLRVTRSDDPDAYARSIEGRVAAMARAHSMLAEGQWESASLRGLVEGELAAFRSEAPAWPPAAAERLTVEGPDVALAPDAVQGFSVAMHELVTNAAKFGALSTPEGRITVAWTLAREPRHLVMAWSERGGPRVAGAPANNGFGSRVIDATIMTQLGGTIARDWSEEGLVCQISVPAARILASPPAATCV